MDSITATALQKEIVLAMGVTIPQMTLLRGPATKALAAQIAGMVDTSGASSGGGSDGKVCLEKLSKTKLKQAFGVLVAFPFNGGSHEVFQPIADELDAHGMATFAVSLPGWGYRDTEIPYDSLQDIVTDLQPALEELFEVNCLSCSCTLTVVYRLDFLCDFTATPLGRCLHTFVLCHCA